MKKTQSLKEKFINTFYSGDYFKYLRAKIKDYCVVHIQWLYFVQELFGTGEISQAQYESIVL